MYQYKIGERVVLTGVYFQDSRPIGVIGVVTKLPTKRDHEIIIHTGDGGGWHRCTSFDVGPESGKRHNVIRPLTTEEKMTLDNALDPFVLAMPQERAS